MSKLLPTLFLIVLVALIGGVAYVSLTDIEVETSTIENTISLEQFKADKQQ